MTVSNTPTLTEEQQAAAIVERLYAPLVKELNLTPDQNKRFYQVILENKMKGQAQMANLLLHENPSRMVKIVADLQKEADANLEALLGAANFAQYQEYQTGIGDRGMLELTKSDFAEHPLTEEQQQHLLTAVAEGRKAVANTAGGNGDGFSIADTIDVMKLKLSRQESIDKHVLEHAASFLSPAQWRILGSIQSKRMDTRKKGYSQAQAMFGDQKGDSNPPISGTKRDL